MDRVERGAAVVARVEVAVAGFHLDVERDEAARGDDELGRVARLHPTVEDDAGVDRLVVALEVADDCVAARLLLAVADHPERDRRRARGDELLDRLELHPELSLVVGDAARVQPLAAGLGDERLGLPQLEWRRRLDVVVAVHEHRRRAGWAGDLADHEAAVLAQLGLAAERANPLGDPLAGAGDVRGVRGIRADARNREELGELVEPAVRECAPPRTDRTP